MIKPYRDMILIKPDEPNDKTDSGILIPKQAQENTHIGTVLNVAANVNLVKKGERVFYSKWAGIDVDDGKIIKETDVFGIFDE